MLVQMNCKIDNTNADLPYLLFCKGTRPEPVASFSTSWLWRCFASLRQVSQFSSLLYWLGYFLPTHYEIYETINEVEMT